VLFVNSREKLKTKWDYQLKVLVCWPIRG